MTRALQESITQMFDEYKPRTNLYGWLRNGRIFGTSYLEWTGDNLVLTFFCRICLYKGILMAKMQYYYQRFRSQENESLGLKKTKLFTYLTTHSMITLMVFLTSIQFFIWLTSKIMQNGILELLSINTLIVALILAVDSPICLMVLIKLTKYLDAFNGLEPGEDIIHGNDIVVKELQGTQRAFEYGKYTDDILKKIHMALKVPITMWEKPEQARPIFEPYVKYLQAAVEAAINSQLMPQLHSGNARFKFRQINVQDAFVKAKTDMVYLSEGVLSPGEVRMERGLNPDGIQETQEYSRECSICLEERTKIRKKKVCKD